VDTKELEALDQLHHSSIDENGGVLGFPFPVVYDYLLRLDHVEGVVVVLTPQYQVYAIPIGCLIVVGDQATDRCRLQTFVTNWQQIVMCIFSLCRFLNIRIFSPVVCFRQTDLLQIKISV
jgi:hypothetical protein